MGRKGYTPVIPIFINQPQAQDGQSSKYSIPPPSPISYPPPVHKRAIINTPTTRNI